jgi:hypothetical protein
MPTLEFLKYASGEDAPDHTTFQWFAPLEGVKFFSRMIYSAAVQHHHTVNR